LASLRHPCKFNRLSRLGSVTAQHSSSRRQPNFASLNRGRHLYLAGRPSRWALAHIIVTVTVLWSPYVIGQTIIFLPCDFYLSFFISSFFLSFFPRLISAAVDWISTILHTWCGLSANLRCRSETCCTRLTENAGRKKLAKNRHLGTIAQLCRAISSQLRHESTVAKKLVKQRYVLHISSQYGELRPTNGGDPSCSLRHPCKFQRVSRLGSFTARHLVVGVSQTYSGVEQRAPLVFGRSTITLSIGPHSSYGRPM